MTAALRILTPPDPAAPPVAKESPATQTPAPPMSRGSDIAPRFNPDPVALALAEIGLDLAAFSCRVTAAGKRDPRSQQALGAAWTCWSESQRALLVEVGKDPGIPSDEFSRQDEWLSAMYGDEVIAVGAVRWIDMNLSYFEEDSYFRAWPADSRRAITRIGSKVALVTNVAVTRAWRGRLGSFAMKELMAGLCIQHFNESEADVLVATMRNQRGMNKVIYNLGATPVVTGLKHPVYGEEIDLVIIEKRPLAQRFAHDLNGDLIRVVWRDLKEETS